MIGPSRAAGAERRVTWVTCVVLVVLHLVLAGHVSVLGATPDFLLVLTACLSFMKGSRDGAIAGFVCGLVFDLTGSGPIGLSCLLGCVAGFVMGLSNRNVLIEGWRKPALTLLAVSLCYNVVYVLFLLAFGESVDFGAAALGRIVVGTLIDCAIGVVVLFVVSRRLGGQRLASGGMRLR